MSQSEFSVSFHKVSWHKDARLRLKQMFALIPHTRHLWQRWDVNLNSENVQHVACLRTSLSVLATLDVVQACCIFHL